MTDNTNPTGVGKVLQRLISSNTPNADHRCEIIANLRVGDVVVKYSAPEYTALVEKTARHEISEFSDDESRRGQPCLLLHPTTNYGKFRVRFSDGEEVEVNQVDLVARTARTDASFLAYQPADDRSCSVCYGDCSEANPPVLFCPMKDQGDMK